MRIGIVGSAVAAVTCAALAMFAQGALAQSHALAQQLVGTWRYVSVDIVRPDGTRTPLYGSNPQGFASFDASGNYLLMTARADLPRFGVNDRTRGSAEENEAVVHGSIAHFGTYAVNEDDSTITFHIRTSTFPNWNGTEQTRPFTIAADDLTWRTPASSGGGTAEVVLKRAAR